MARKRRRFTKSDAAEEAASCGCCLFDVFTVVVVLTGALAWRHRRR
jgi:hypothetical protein